MIIPASSSSPFVIVDKVTETRGIDHGQLQSDSILLNVYYVSFELAEPHSEQLTSADALDVDGLAPVGPWCRDVFGLIQLGLEESVDECRFTESRLAWTSQLLSPYER